MKVTEALDVLEVPYLEHGSHHHSTEGWAQIDCPWCSRDSNKYRMGVNLHYGNCHCWVCGSHSLRDTLRELLYGSPTSLNALEAVLRDLTPQNRATPLTRSKLVLPKGLGELKGCHRDYLEGRGLDSDKMVRLWGLQGIGLAIHLAWRIFIPIHYRGEIVSWTTRATVEGRKEKYWTARPDQEKMSAKGLLYGNDVARHTILIVEGPFDVLRIGPGAVATLGMVTSKAQVLAMSQHPVRYVCFDSEVEAQKRARKLCQELSLFPGVTHNVELESGKDPGECGMKEVRQLRGLLT